MLTMIPRPWHGPVASTLLQFEGLTSCPRGTDSLAETSHELAGGR